MKIKSAKSFRYYFKVKVKDIDKLNDKYNEDFIGTYHIKNGRRIKGFFELYHGDKPDIASYLPSILKIAEDGQAIYEFLQNAVDCGSTHFYIFYNDDYFLAINNGSPFDNEGLKSILNIAQTTKDHNKIGRFGIGFKLAHRLVGQNEGTDELVNEYKGPILFSWSKYEDLESLINNEQIQPLVRNRKNYHEFNSLPYLLKILLTNFPTDPNEKVKDINYQERILFPKEELNELIDFINEYFSHYPERKNSNILKNGSLFFIKLGKDKKKLLDKDYSEIKNGIQYSMNTLRRLQKVYINSNDIGKTPLQLEEGTIIRGSDEFERISPEYKELDIKFSIGFYKIDFSNEKSFSQIVKLKEKPNFYKYFPMSDEINGFGFIVHCDSFSNEANRRRLQQDDINKNLFPFLANHITDQLKDYKTNDRDKFLNIYAALLLSDNPNKQNNKWLKPIFYDKILDVLQKNIPTKNSYSENVQNIKINNLKTQITLSDFGLSHIQWFEWNNDTAPMLIEEAKKDDKLNIEEWDIRDIVENSDIKCINNWISTCDNETYKEFLEELESSTLRNSTKYMVRKIKLFKFSNGDYYSIGDLIKLSKNLYYRNNKYSHRYEYSIPNVMFRTVKIENIFSELSKLGIILSEISTSQYPNIFSSVTKWPDEKSMYNIIAEKCKTNNLSVKEKEKIFKNFISDSTKFDNVGDNTLKSLQLFCDNNSVIKPLNKLVGNIQSPKWLNIYKIKEDEYFSELDPFLLSKADEIFENIFQPNNDTIIAQLTTAEEVKSLIDFYNENQRAFFKEFIIRKESNRFVIDNKTNETFQVQSADAAARGFIDKHCADNLFVLPGEFVEKYRDEEGIIKADDLYALILKFVDTDEQKETLVDIVKYKAKYNLLTQLTEFRFSTSAKYTKEDYEYKILDLACSELNGKDLISFRNKVVIETEHKELKLTEIPPIIEKITIHGYELSLAKILPNNYENSDHLSSLLNQFIELGLDEERIRNLFGISEEPNPNSIFEILSEQVTTLENAEQLAFVLLIARDNSAALNNFKVKTLDNEIWDLKYNYYTHPQSFIGNDYLLMPQYAAINELLKLPINIGNTDNQILLEPYFHDGKFICPCLNNDLSDEQRLNFIEFLFRQWNKQSKRTIIQSIDWSTIDGEDTLCILGFNPTISVFPSDYACDSEILPDYMINWVGKERSKIDFLSDLGIWTEDSVIVRLRRYLSDTIDEFNNNHLAQEIRFNEHETNLFNSFVWLKEKEITLKTPEQYETFKKAVDVINENRANSRDLKIKEEFDFEELEENANVWEESYYENWKENSDVAIYLYEGELPKNISLNEIDNYVFHYFYEGNTAIYDENNIYVNRNADVKKELRKLELENDDFNFDGLWQNKLEVLEEENAKLRRSIEATIGTELSTDISQNDQKEANREAKKIVKEKLENEGYEFREGIGQYSTINGVFKNDTQIPLVVKSYLSQEEPLKIGAKEWIELMKPNSMLWLHFGNGELGCLKLNELLRYQDKITLSFSTENLDVESRLQKFAELLQFFGNVHFNFNSVKPSDYSVAKDLSDYKFYERDNEKDLSSDDDSKL